MSKLNQIWVFQYLEQVSNNYHSGGGLVIVAKNEENARHQLEQHKDIVVPEEAWAEALTGETTLGARVIVFPDAGCC